MLRSLLKKWTVVAALLYILLLVLVAVFCYWMAPDDTSYANQNITAIANLHPGESVDMLRVPLITEAKKRSNLEVLYRGQVPLYDYIPYDSVDLSGIYPGISTFTHGDTTIRYWQQLDHKTDDVQQETRTYLLGTDKLGRDILSRLMVGARVSLSVGTIAVVISISLGLLIGSIAGYFGGRVDDFVMWLINVFWAIPTILLVFAIVMALGKGFWQIFIAIGITMWVGPARIIRGQVLSLKEENYIKATKTLGFSPLHIIFRHVLPNILGVLMVLSAANFATAILIEAGLSFLGVGIQPPMTSWGLMIKEQYNYLITDNPVPTLVPGIAIMLTVLSFNILGNALRDAFDVKA